MTMRMFLSTLAGLFAAGAVAAGPSEGEWKIHVRAGDSEVVVTTSARFAGAIQSLTWDNFEFIDSADHGRELQSACSFDNSPSANSETYNPTEAGSRKDGAGTVSTSRLLEIMADGNHLRTRTRMAFWLAAGERSDGQLARNTNELSDFLLTKDLRIGTAESSHSLDYLVTFTVPTNTHHLSAQFEALTGYLPQEFEKFWLFNPETGKLEPLDDGPGEIKRPVVLATVDGRHAMGIYAPPPYQLSSSGPRYGRWKFLTAKTVKWNCVFRVQNPEGIHTGDYSYHLKVPFGTLSEVESMLRSWIESAQTGSPLRSGAAYDTVSMQVAPAVLPGKGLAQHPFLYAGEWDTRKPLEQSIFIVRNGKVAWQYSMPLKTASGGNQEFDDATLLSNGNVIFSRMSGAGMVSPDKRLLWDYVALPGTEVHSCQSIGLDRVLIMRNGNPAQAMIINTASGKIEKEIPIPNTVKATHGQFRHIRMTAAGTLLVPHLGEGKVVEYDLDGKELWSVAAKSPWQAVRLKDGNTLIAGDKNRYAREVNPKGETIWEFTPADAIGYKLGNLQTADRLANGNTLMCFWIAGDNNTAHWPGTVQVLEVTREKKIVWALSSWRNPDLGPATSIQLLDEPGAVEDNGQAR